MRTYIKNVYTLVDRKPRLLLGFLLVFLVGSFLDVLGLLLIGPFIDIIMNQEKSFVIDYLPGAYQQDISNIIVISGVLLAAIYFFKSIYSLWSQWLIINFTQNIQVDLRVSLSSNILKRSMQELEDSDSSEILQNVHTLTNSFTLQTVYPLLKIASELLMVLGIVSFLIMLDPLAMGLLLIIFGGFLWGYDKWCKKPLNELGEVSNQSSQDLLAFIADIFSGYREIKLLNKSDQFLQRIKDKSKHYAISASKYFMLSTAPRYILEFIVVIFLVTYVLLSIFLGVSFETIINVAGVFAVASVRLLPTGTSLLNSVVQLRYSRDAVDRLTTAFKDPPDLFYGDEGSVNSSIPKNTSESLKIINGSYRYPKNELPTLSNINLELKLGACIGVIGESGSGKSTLISLLMGIRELTSGDIILGDVPLHEQRKIWHSRVSYLPQDTFLFSGTLSQNVQFNPLSQSADFENVKNSLEIAGFVPSDGSWNSFLESSIAEGGKNLSGGQRQRVAFARAIYHDRNFMFMDEITSALDAPSEIELLAQLKLMKGSRTIIIISHSKNIMNVCDEVYEVKDGTVIHTKIA